MSSILYFTLFYVLFSGCMIYPPTEFITAGLTIEVIFSKWLGSESTQFIQYHIRRIVLTKLIHSALPLGYIYGLYTLIEDEQVNLLFGDVPLSLVWIVVYAAGVAILISPVFLILTWAQNHWKGHPVVENLTIFCNNSNASWIYVAADINREYRRVDKINIRTNSVTRIVATDNWIMKISSYTIEFARQNDTTLVVYRSDTHDLSQYNRGEVQFLNIEICSTSAVVPPFTIRLNALDFKDLQEKIVRPIAVLPNVTFHKTKLERFVDAFKEQVVLNEHYRTTQELESCIGCMQTPANVKLRKLCGDISTGDSACVSCACRPMWCLDCIVKWFASRQDQEVTESWLSSKCTCPMCRSNFCVLDVSLIDRHE